VAAKTDTVYVCDDCDARYLGEQRCTDCNRWCRRLGPGGSCPSCEEPVAIADLFTDDQLNQPPATKQRKQPTTT
jgi:hypothetical protein